MRDTSTSPATSYFFKRSATHFRAGRESFFTLLLPNPLIGVVDEALGESRFPRSNNILGYVLLVVDALALSFRRIEEVVGNSLGAAPQNVLQCLVPQLGGLERSPSQVVTILAGLLHVGSTRRGAFVHPRQPPSAATLRGI